MIQKPNQHVFCSAQVQYSNSNIREIVKTIYSFGCYFPRLLFTALAFISIFAGLNLGANTWQGIILIAVACIYLTNRDVPQRIEVRKIKDAFISGHINLAYEFFDEFFIAKTAYKETKTSYSSLKYLLSINGYYYLFYARKSAYVIDRSTLNVPDSEFRSFLSAITGLKWKTSLPGFPTIWKVFSSHK